MASEVGVVQERLGSIQNTSDWCVQQFHHVTRGRGEIMQSIYLLNRTNQTLTVSVTILRWLYLWHAYYTYLELCQGTLKEYQFEAGYPYMEQCFVTSSMYTRIILKGVSLGFDRCHTYLLIKYCEIVLMYCEIIWML